MTTDMHATRCPCEAGVRPSTAYRRGCRHEPARRWKARYSKRHTTGRLQPAYIDGTGTARRLQALAALGWSTDHLAARLGIRASTVGKLRRRQHPRVRRDNADRIAQIYDQLWDQPGPSRHMRERASCWGWHVPMAWDDDTIDDPNARPDTGSTRTPSRHLTDPVVIDQLIAGHTRAADCDRIAVAAAITELDRRGHTAAAIAEHLDIPERRIQRHRARTRARTTSGEAA